MELPMSEAGPPMDRVDMFREAQKTMRQEGWQKRYWAGCSYGDGKKNTETKIDGNGALPSFGNNVDVVE